MAFSILSEVASSCDSRHELCKQGVGSGPMLASTPMPLTRVAKVACEDELASHAFVAPREGLTSSMQVMSCDC